jgi:hypothetical protein
MVVLQGVWLHWLMAVRVHCAAAKRYEIAARVACLIVALYLEDIGHTDDVRKWDWVILTDIVAAIDRMQAYCIRQRTHSSVMWLQW